MKGFLTVPQFSYLLNFNRIRLHLCIYLHVALDQTGELD